MQDFKASILKEHLVVERFFEYEALNSFEPDFEQAYYSIKAVRHLNPRFQIEEPWQWLALVAPKDKLDAYLARASDEFHTVSGLGMIPIHFAALGGNEVFIRACLAGFNCTTNQNTIFPDTVLQFATLSGRVGLVRYLWGPNCAYQPHSSDDNRLTSYAALSDEIELVRFFIEEAGLDCEPRDDRSYFSQEHFARFAMLPVRDDVALCQAYCLSEPDLKKSHAKYHYKVLMHYQWQPESDLHEGLVKHAKRVGEYCKAELKAVLYDVDGGRGDIASLRHAVSVGDNGKPDSYLSVAFHRNQNKISGLFKHIPKTVGVIRSDIAVYEAAQVVSVFAEH